MKHFQKLSSAGWKEVFNDPCTGNWNDNWTIDGLKAKITNSKEGMDFAAGPVNRDNSCHAVLWSRQSFKGDIRIDYEYTKLDETVHNATIIYIQATGQGIGDYDKDISRWSHLRQVPSMDLYFNHMNTYHISYATFEVTNTDPENDYIRARRYMPEAMKNLSGTALTPDYFRTDLFKTGVPHGITVIKKEHDLCMRIQNDEKELLCHWKTDSLPPIVDGRIGLRHMCTRSARYRHFCVSVLNEQDEKEVDHH